MKLRRPDLSPGQIYEQAKDVLAQLARQQWPSGAEHPSMAGLCLDEDQAMRPPIQRGDASWEELAPDREGSKPDRCLVSQGICEGAIPERTPSDLANRVE